MRLRELVLAAVAVLLGIALGACGTIEIEGKKIDYKSAKRLPPLDVPPDLTKPSADNRYTLPDTSPRGTATYSEYSRGRGTQNVASAGSVRVLPKQDGAQIMRDGSQRWLLVNGEPAQLWPVVKDFWQELGFIVNVEMPEAGIMETDWAENRAKALPDAGWFRSFFGKMLDLAYSTSERDKFRTRFERGSAAGTTEIYVSHRGMEEIYTSAQQDKTEWQPRPPDPNLEAEMLGRLMARLGADEAQVKSQLATGGKRLPLRATLSKDSDGGRTLALEDQFDRAWRRVGLALDRVGFTVEDRDRSKGLYFVRYIDPQIDNKAADEKGWLSRLKFWGTSKPKQERFRIEVKDNAQGCQVKVLNKDGAQENTETAGRILALLYDQLK